MTLYDHLKLTRLESAFTVSIIFLQTRHIKMYPTESVVIYCEFVRGSLVLLSLSDAGKPGPPDAPSISDVTKTGCVVAWQPPKEDGGSPVTGYHVERCLATTDRWLKINKGPVAELKFAVTDLVEGNEYQLRISAENKVGVGPPSSPCPPFVAKDAFSKCAVTIRRETTCLLWAL